MKKASRKPAKRDTWRICRLVAKKLRAASLLSGAAPRRPCRFQKIVLGCDRFVPSGFTVRSCPRSRIHWAASRISPSSKTA